VLVGAGASQGSCVLSVTNVGLMPLTLSNASVLTTGHVISRVNVSVPPTILSGSSQTLEVLVGLNWCFNADECFPGWSVQVSIPVVG